eukprot:2811049-Pleurochrysis_carterae.AAC.1
MGASGYLRLASSKEEIIPYHTILYSYTASYFAVVPKDHGTCSRLPFASSRHFVCRARRSVVAAMEVNAFSSAAGIYKLASEKEPGGRAFSSSNAGTHFSWTPAAPDAAAIAEEKQERRAWCRCSVHRGEYNLLGQKCNIAGSETWTISLQSFLLCLANCNEQPLNCSSPGADGAMHGGFRLCASDTSRTARNYRRPTALRLALSEWHLHCQGGA